MRPDSSTTLPVDTGLSITVRSPARQGLAYQFSSVGWFHLFTFSCHLTHHQSSSAAPISFRRNPIQYVKHLVTPYTPREREGLAIYTAFHAQGHGYFKVQSTRPQTLGYGLADSPVGMLAWIYEKLVQWTDSYPWTDEEGAYFGRPSYSRFTLTLVSIDLDINLLVLPCGTSSIGEDLLRGGKIRRLPVFSPLASNCACWHILLSKGNRPITSSVGLSLSFF